MGSKIKWNVWLNAAIFVAFTLTALTGVLLWLVLPDGKGSAYAVFLGLTKRDWTTIHDWAGVAMLAGVVAHLVLHWEWIACVSARFLRRTSRSARINFSLDAILGEAFIAASLSGLISWLALGGGGYQGGRNPFYNAVVLGLARDGWNDVHLWAGVVMMAGAALHLALHWRWIICAVRNLARLVVCAVRSEPAAGECIL